LLRTALADYEYAIDYYGFASDDRPDYVVFSAEQWSALRRAYEQAMNVVAAARSLVAPTMGLVIQPPNVDSLRRNDIGLVVDVLLGRPLQADPGVELEGPAGPDFLYTVVLMFEGLRLQPAITLGSGWDDGAPDFVVATRLTKLADCRVQARTDRTQRYLTLVARCYLHGLLPELAAVSRAAMEACLDDVAPDEAVIAKLGRARPGGRVTLGARLEFCRATGLLDGPTFKAAELVANAGNDVLHQTDAIAPPADDVLDALVNVLNSLASSTDGAAGAT
jgi:hypothetical protein